MATVGGAWAKYEKDKHTISISFDDALLPLTITKDKRMCLTLIPDDKKHSDKSPDYRVDMFIPKEKDE